MINVADLLGIIDTLDVPSLALIVIYLSLRNKRSFEKRMASHETASVAAMNAIKEAMVAQTTETRGLVAAFETHMKNDRDDFQRIYDKLEGKANA